jgi:hypothetical protein
MSLSLPDTGVLSKMNTVTAMRNNAVLNLAVSECFEIGEHVRWKAVRCRPGETREGHIMTTWLPENSVPVRMSVLRDGRTVVEVDKRIFYASPMLSLRPECPTEIVFLGHYTEDRVSYKNILGNIGYRIEPRVLVYDVMYTDRVTQPCVESRYETLRTFLAEHLVNTIATVQWVGHQEAAETLLEKDPGFGHKIASLLYLTNTPGEIIKPLSVHIQEPSSSKRRRRSGEY